MKSYISKKELEEAMKTTKGERKEKMKHLKKELERVIQLRSPRDVLVVPGLILLFRSTIRAWTSH